MLCHTVLYDGSFAQILFSALSGLFRAHHEKLERLGIDCSRTI